MNILWYQPEILTDEDIIVLNGTRLNNGMERTKAFDRLKKIADQAIGKKRPWHGYLEGYYFVKGSLDRKDERGRQLSFMFMADEADGSSQLYHVLSTLDIGLDPDTETLVNNKEAKKSAPQTLLWALFLLALIVVFALICHHYGK